MKKGIGERDWTRFVLANVMREQVAVDEAEDAGEVEVVQMMVGRIGVETPAGELVVV